MFAHVRAYLKNDAAKSSEELLVSLGVVQPKLASGFLLQSLKIYGTARVLVL